MNRALSAYLALALAPVGWLLASWGLMSQLGDPAPSVTIEQINALHARSMLIAIIGVLMLVSATWLSGYSYGEARKRAALALAAVVSPLLIIYAWFYL